MKRKSSFFYVRVVLTVLVALTAVGFASFDYKNIDFLKALQDTFCNISVMFSKPAFHHFTFLHAVQSLGITAALAFLTTLLGAIISLPVSFFAAGNLSNHAVSRILKNIVAVIRAVPTVLWVLIFATAVGLGSEAAVLGMMFHTMGYLIKAYSETFEKQNSGIIEALRACGGNWWHIIFNAVLPVSAAELAAWTFLRFEINFGIAVAMGAAAGAGGLGYELFMASGFYFDVREAGFITITILLAVFALEYLSTVIKNKILR
ncbi:MAG: ABC transporter permease subunit [Treponema sp.]|nr:ABC transporter permease subunit [Treponema sp.]